MIGGHPPSHCGRHLGGNINLSSKLDDNIWSTWSQYLEIFAAPGDNIWKYLEHLETKVGGFHSKGAGTVNQGAGGRGQGRKSSTNAGGENHDALLRFLECFVFLNPTSMGCMLSPAKGSISVLRWWTEWMCLYSARMWMNLKRK